MITDIELSSGVSPSVCHGTFPLPLFAVASSTFLLELKHRLPPKAGLSQSSSANSTNNLLKAAWVDEILALWIVTFI